MKIVYVVDSVNDLKTKIDTLKTRFGNEIFYIVKSHFQKFVKSFGLTINAVYSKNLAKVMHFLLQGCKADDDIIIYYNSLELSSQLLDKFVLATQNGNRFVNLVPKYNVFERISNSAYNLYVKSMFKNKDSMATPKLQFIPKRFLSELLASHIANKLFEIDPIYVTNIYIEDKQINKTAKIKPKFNKFYIIPLLVVMIIALLSVVSLIFIKPNYLFWLILSFAVLLDVVLALIFAYKNKFDQRFLH